MLLRVISESRCLVLQIKHYTIPYIILHYPLVHYIFKPQIC